MYIYTDVYKRVHPQIKAYQKKKKYDVLKNNYMNKNIQFLIIWNIYKSIKIKC